MNKLKEVFSHNEAAAKEVQKLCEQALQESIEEKYCIACKHYSYDPWVPGYIAYEGDCDLGHTAFLSIVLLVSIIHMILGCLDTLLMREIVI